MLRDADGNTHERSKALAKPLLARV